MKQGVLVFSLSLNSPDSASRSDLDVAKVTGTWKWCKKEKCISKLPSGSLPWLI